MTAGTEWPSAPGSLDRSKGEAMSTSGVRRIRVHTFTSRRVISQETYIVEEVGVCIHIHGQPWVTLMCSPHDIDELVLGFLRGEGVITSPEDIADIVPAPNDFCVDVWLHDPPAELPSRLTVTSGCGGGVTFASLQDHIPPVDEEVTVAFRDISRLMGEVVRGGTRYALARGIHAAALATPEGVLILAEDIGRHNAVDRVWGKAMKEGIETRGRILLTTGRVSSEMLRKAALMRVPIVASRTSPTGLSVELARAWNITLVGYVRRTGLRVYTGEHRIR